jgi:hypothetical protein
MRVLNHLRVAQEDKELRTRLDTGERLRGTMGMESTVIRAGAETEQAQRQMDFAQHQDIAADGVKGTWKASLPAVVPTDLQR